MYIHNRIDEVTVLLMMATMISKRNERFCSLLLFSHCMFERTRLHTQIVTKKENCLKEPHASTFTKTQHAAPLQHQQLYHYLHPRIRGIKMIQTKQEVKVGEERKRICIIKGEKEKGKWYGHKMGNTQQEKLLWLPTTYADFRILRFLIFQST